MPENQNDPTHQSPAASVQQAAPQACGREDLPDAAAQEQADEVVHQPQQGSGDTIRQRVLAPGCYTVQPLGEKRANNCVLSINSRGVVDIIGEVVAWRDFTPALAVFATGVEDFADIMDRDVLAAIWPDHSMIVFERAADMPGQSIPDVISRYEAVGWKSLAAHHVRYYSSLLIYQASPG